MSKTIPVWQTEMWSVIKRICNEDRFDFKGVYIALEHIAEKYLIKGEMREGDQYKIPCEDGTEMLMEFYKNYSCLYKKWDTDKISTIVSQKHSIKQEYEMLDFVREQLEASGLGIGTPYPKELKAFLTDCKTGDTITFQNGKSFVVLDTNSVYTTFTRTCDKTTVPYIENFYNQERFVLDKSQETSMRNFYASVKDNVFASTTRVKAYSFEKGQNEINKQIAGLERGKTRLLTIGPNELRVKRSRHNQELTWYDKTGKKVPEEAVRALLGWMNTAPVRTEFIREKSNYITEYNDDQAKDYVEKMYHEHNYYEAYDYLTEYCIQQGRSLSVNLSTYDQDTGNAFTIVFKEKNGQCTPYLITYEHNDFEKADPSSIKKISRDEYQQICEKVMDYALYQVQNKVLQEYPEYINKTIAILDIASTRAVTAMTDYKELSADIDTLLDSYDNETPETDDLTH